MMKRTLCCMFEHDLCTEQTSADTATTYLQHMQPPGEKPLWVVTVTIVQRFDPIIDQEHVYFL